LHLPTSRASLRAPFKHRPTTSAYRADPPGVIPSRLAMFTSHKSDAPPQSRQSFVDSPVTGPSSLPTPPVAWNPQCFDDYPYGATQSSEQKHRVYPNKRSSVFNLRARSNTTASTVSTASSFMSLNPSDMAYAETSRPGSPLTYRHHRHQGQTEQSGSRKSLFRGRKGKRLSDSVSSSSVMTEYQEMDLGDKRTSVLRKGKRRNNQPEAPCKCFNCTQQLLIAYWMQ